LTEKRGSSCTIYQLDKALKTFESQTAPATEDDKIRELVPQECHAFLPLFKKAVAEVLPPHCPYDHKLPLRENFTPPFGPLYSLLSKPELKNPTGMDRRKSIQRLYPCLILGYLLVLVFYLLGGDSSLQL